MIKWVARLALITALLGLVGTIIIISNISGNDKEQKNIEAAKKTEKPAARVNDSPPVHVPEKPIITANSAKNAVVAPKETPAPKNLAILKKSDEKVIPPPPAQIEEKKKTVAKPQDVVKKEEPEESKKEPEEKLFSPEELQQLVTRINRAREENGITSNCVQIHTTRQGNYPRTIGQVETYLKSRRFAIAGREVVSTKVKGILISPTAGCIRITIGTF